MIIILAVTSLDPKVVTIQSHTKEPFIPYGYGRQDPIIPPSLNHLNSRPNIINALATMVVVQSATRPCNERYSPLSQMLSELSSISTLPMNFEYSAKLGGIFRRRNIFLWWTLANLSCFEAILYAANPEKTEMRIEHGMSFPWMGSVAAHLQSLQLSHARKKDIPMLRVNTDSYTFIHTSKNIYTSILTYS